MEMVSFVFTLFLQQQQKDKNKKKKNLLSQIIGARHFWKNLAPGQGILHLLCVRAPEYLIHKICLIGRYRI